MIISLISQKGGVGKSAVARLIAVAFAQADWSVKIADLDTGQGTSTKWKARRDLKSIKPEIPVEKYATVDRAIRDAEAFDLMILDGPAFAEQGGKRMAQASDLVIVPTGYGLDDLEPQVETAQDLESSGLDPDKIRFIFCRADGSPSEDRAARKYLQRAGMTVLKNIYPERPSVRQAMNNGLSGSEVSHASVRNKIAPLAAEVAQVVIAANDAAIAAQTKPSTAASAIENIKRGEEEWTTA